MASGPSELIYLEPDDEITAVVRRLRAASAPRVVLVASGRTKATSSAIALRLLAQIAGEEGRAVVLVADPTARTLAAEAGIEAFASVAEAEADGASPAPAPAPRRAAIRVVREAPAAQPIGPPPTPAASPAVAAPGDETRAIPVVRPERVRRTIAAREWIGSWRPSTRRTLLVAIAAILLVGAAALAAVLPAATVEITPATSAVGPHHYTVEPPVAGPETATLTANEQGTPSGDRVQEIAATGNVTFYNWNTVDVSVPAGTTVSSGTITFTTQQGITVPHGDFSGRTLTSGEGTVGVKATTAGPTGNVAAKAIDTVNSSVVAALLRGFPSLRKQLVINPAPTAGGDEVHHSVVQQEDVDQVVAALRADIQTQIAAKLAADPDRIYPPSAAAEIVVDVPGDLVGSEDLENFELSASYDLSRSYVTRTDAEAAAAGALRADRTAVPAGQSLLPDTIQVTLGNARQQGDAIDIDAAVSARAAADVDVDSARQAVMGLTPDEAQGVLQEMGQVDVQLWPAWVDRIPRLDWRVKVEVVGR